MSVFFRDIRDINGSMLACLYEPSQAKPCRLGRASWLSCCDIIKLQRTQTEASQTCNFGTFDISLSYLEDLISSLSGLICCHLCCSYDIYDCVIRSSVWHTGQLSAVGSVLKHSAMWQEQTEQNDACSLPLPSLHIWGSQQTYFWNPAAALWSCSACSSALVTISTLGLMLKMLSSFLKTSHLAPSSGAASLSSPCSFDGKVSLHRSDRGVMLVNNDASLPF